MGSSSGVQGLAAAKRQATAGHGVRPGGHRRPRGREGTHPGRNSYVQNVGTPLESGHIFLVAGKPTVRKAESPRREQDDPTSQCRWPKGNRKPRPNRPAPPPVVVDNWPDTGTCPDPKGC